MADEPIPLDLLAEIAGEKEGLIEKTLNEMKEEYVRDERGWQLREIAGGYRLYTHPGYANYVEKFILKSRYPKLSQAALETLAIIAYKQPVPRSVINAIRGVRSESVIATLLEKGLIKEAGKEKSPGLPVLFATTKSFLEALGLKDIKELPSVEEFLPDQKTIEGLEKSIESLGSGL